MQCRREFHRIAVPEHMHVKGRRLRAQEMIVQSRDLDATGEQLLHDRADLAFGQHEIAHHHGIGARALEGDPGAERQRRLQLDTIKRDMQIGARHAHPINLARHHRAGFAKRSSDLAPIGFGGRGGEGSEADHTRDRGGASNAHDASAHERRGEGLINIDALHLPFLLLLIPTYACRMPLFRAYLALDAASLSPASRAISAGACSGIGITELTLISHST